MRQTEWLQETRLMREGGSRSYTWIKNTLQQAGVVNKAPSGSSNCTKSG